MFYLLLFWKKCFHFLNFRKVQASSLGSAVVNGRLFSLVVKHPPGSSLSSLQAWGVKTYEINKYVQHADWISLALYRNRDRILFSLTLPQCNIYFLYVCGLKYSWGQALVSGWWLKCCRSSDGSRRVLPFCKSHFLCAAPPFVNSLITPR